jgi:hypothetical protein
VPYLLLVPLSFPQNPFRQQNLRSDGTQLSQDQKAGPEFSGQPVLVRFIAMCCFYPGQQRPIIKASVPPHLLNREEPGEDRPRPSGQRRPRF